MAGQIAKVHGMIQQASRYAQGNRASLAAGGGAIRSIAMPRKKQRRGGQGGQSKKGARQLHDQLKNL